MPSFSQNPSLKFNGTDNVIAWADATPVLRTSENHTWEMWVKGVSTTVGVLYTEGWSGSNFRSQFRLNADGNGKLEIEFRNYAGTYLIANNSLSTTTIFDGTWHHIAIVGTTTAGVTSTVLFVDGVQDATNFGTYTRPTLWDATDGGALNQSVIGQIARASERLVNVNYTWYNGEIDEFRAWTRALGVTEISGNKCTPLNTTSLYRHVKFNEGTGTTFANQGSSGNSGTLLGTTDAGTYTTNSSCVSLATNELTLNSGIEVYPNPTNNMVNINKTDSTIEIKNVNLFDSLGKIIYSKKDIQSIDLTNVIKGIYFLRIESENGSVYTQKIIKN